MDKKDIYEHLAKIYLDASSKRTKKQKKLNPFVRQGLFVVAALCAGISIFFASKIIYHNPANGEIALYFTHDAVKINFNFDPAKKEAYTVTLNQLDFKRYKDLAFTVKKASFSDKITLRVEVVNAYQEKAEVYVRDIPHRWKDYRVSLADFKGISDWTEMAKLSFVVEEWNTKNKHGVVYIDNVRLLK